MVRQFTLTYWYNIFYFLVAHPFHVIVMHPVPYQFVYLVDDPRVFIWGDIKIHVNGTDTFDPQTNQSRCVCLNLLNALRRESAQSFLYSEKFLWSLYFLVSFISHIRLANTFFFEAPGSDVEQEQSLLLLIGLAIMSVILNRAKSFRVVSDAKRLHRMWLITIFIVLRDIDIWRTNAVLNKSSV